MQLSLFVSLFLATAGAEADTTKVAVLEVLVEGGADPSLGTQLAARLAEVIDARSGYEVIAPDDIRAMLEQERQKQLLGCEDDSCLAQIAGALGVDLVVKARLSRLEDVLGVSVTAVEPSEGKAINRVSETWGGDAVAVLDLADPIVAKLFSSDPASVTGTVRLSGVDDGAQILVDEEIKGATPVESLELLAGARRVRIVRDDGTPIERWVIVRPSSETALTFAEDSDGEPIYATWWFWTLTTAAVAGAATGAYFALSGGDSDPAGPAGDTGVAVSVNSDSAFGTRL